MEGKSSKYISVPDLVEDDPVKEAKCQEGLKE